MDSKIMAIAVVGVLVVAGVGGFLYFGQPHDEDEKGDYISLARTNELFPGHTCCVVAANANWMTENPDVAERFLAGYIEGVQFLNAALSDKTSPDYSVVVNQIKTLLTGAELTDDEIETALGNITYLYADSDDSLNTLKTDIADLVSGLQGIGQFSKDVPAGFVDNFVDGTCLSGALSILGTPVSAETPVATVRVAVISGDIHQIGIHIAINNEIFQKYKINIEIVPGSAGGEIADSLTSNQAAADVGILGAPPATLKLINGGIAADNAKFYKIIARTNTEGSGVYIKDTMVDDPAADVLTRNGTAFYQVHGTGDDMYYTVSTANAKAWGGLIIGTPGMTSIQHIQIAMLADQMGLDFKLYSVGDKVNEDSIYYVTNINNHNKTVKEPSINAGILWEPQYTKIVTES